MNSFASRVIAWQQAHGRHDLPWQNVRDPYRIWLSEIMLQQTQVATVLPYFSRFVDAFPTVEALAAASIDRVLGLWSGLGYYRRAHLLHTAAREVIDRHAGRFPSDAATLATLPGVGRSTAAAIAAFASGERGAILDGNVKRVLARHRGIEGWPGAPGVQASLWRAAEALLPDAASGAIASYTQGMMDLGAMICTRTRPDCAVCPVDEDCVAHAERRIDTLPAPRPRKAVPQRAVAILLLEHGGQILLEQRPALGIWGGLRSLPEMPLDADVAGYVAEHFGMTIGRVDRLPAIEHAFTHFRLTMHPLRVPVASDANALRAPGVGWFERDEALNCGLPSPIRRLLRTEAGQPAAA